jgi:Arc/MetJ family transcription regulator
LTSVSIQYITICMRTTLDIPEELLTEAQRLLQFKSKTDTIIFSLQELIRRKRIEELKAMAGSINLDIDLERSRRRPTNKKR